MISWITENASTIGISLVLLALMLLAVRKMIKDRKKGGCSCGCGGCAYQNNCPSQEKNTK